jgi:hypothetical protein
MKNPYLIEIFSPKKEVQHLENFFQKSENISFLPEEIQDDIQNCLVESKEDNDNIGIIYALDESIDFIKKILDKHEIVYELKQIRKSIHYGEYPFEVSEDFKKSLEGVFFLTLTMDEILEKIKDKGINSIGDIEREVLVSSTPDIS